MPKVSKNYLCVPIIYFGIFFSQYIMAASDWVVRSKLEVNSAINYNQVSENNFNIGNRILEMPRESLVLLPRGEIRVVYQNKVRGILRPSYRLLGQRIEYKDPVEGKHGFYGKPDLTDAFIDFSLPKGFVFSVGKQSYQWGPSETQSPSNPLFHFERDAKSFLFQEVGKGFVKLNGGLSSTSTLTLLGEVFDNREPNWISEQSFSSKFLARYEKQFESSLNYFGLTAGQIEKQRSFVGEYWNWVLSDAISFYGDARQTQGANNYEPVLNAYGLYDMELAAESKSRYFTLSTLGLRWEGDWDIRLEWLYNEAGYNAEQMKNALSAGSTLAPNLVQNLRRISRSGLELLGKNYGYFSLRQPKFLSISDLTFFLRHFKSLQDGSSATQINLEGPLSDSTIGYLGSSFAAGQSLQEFTLADRVQILFGARWMM